MENVVNVSNAVNNVVIVASARTPVGSFQGALSSLPAPKLGSLVIQEVMRRANLTAHDVQEVIMGQVLTAGAGQAPARQAALYAKINNSTPCLTVNKVCGSGLKAVMLAADNIRLGETQIAIAGGQENMSLAPHLLENSRNGYRMGPAQIVDSMIKDGLWDPYNNFHMGSAAEICVKENSFTRAEQDAFAISSYQKAQKSVQEGLFKNEIAPVSIESKKGTIVVSNDEDPFNTNFEKIPTLKPAFEKDGTITAANASKINDGAAAHVLMSEKVAQARGIKPLAKIIAYSTFAHEPKYFTTAPTGAIKKALSKAQLRVSDVDLWEINEAFAAVAMVAMKDLEIPAEKVNVHGGAIALGHPIGASGARLLTTLVYSLIQKQKRYGLVTLCIGGGEAVAMIIERQ
jgi:acetyl-CoA C-acetyltransferase